MRIFFFSLHKTLIDGLEWCGLLWCFYQLFVLSSWRHPFTAEDPLLSKWCNATFLQICFDEETNKLIYILDGLRTSTFSHTNYYNFLVNYSLNSKILSLNSNDIYSPRSSIAQYYYRLSIIGSLSLLMQDT